LKQDANAEGGTHNPLIFSYPKLTKEQTGIRGQYTHLIDLFPSVLELIGVKELETVRGVKQNPLQGNSLVYAVANKNAPSQHTQQYYTILGNRAIYKDGWKASAAHHPNLLEIIGYEGEPVKKIANDPANETWALYNLNEDFNERVNLANKYPEKLKELKALYDAEADKYHIYPLIDAEFVIQRAF
jgi:arylsulfatase